MVVHVAVGVGECLARFAPKAYAELIETALKPRLIGQNPTDIVKQLATVIDERKKGTALEDAVQKAFEPPKPPEPQQVMDEMAGPGDAGAPIGSAGMDAAREVHLSICGGCVLL